MGKRRDHPASIMAEAINGYLRGMQMKEGMDAREADNAYREELRTNARTDRARADDERRQLTDAARPAVIEEGAGGATKPATMDNRDVGAAGEAAPTPGVTVNGQAVPDRAAADAAAAAHNAPEAVAQRQTDAYRRIGKPVEAAQLENATLQTKKAKFDLDNDKKKFLDEQFDKRLATITTPDQLAKVLSGSPLVEGRQVSVIMDASGKKGQLVHTTDDGAQVKLGKEFDADEKGINKAIVSWSQSMSTPQKVVALQHFQQFEEQQRQFEVNKKLQQEQLGISRGHLGVAQQGLQLQKDKHKADLDNDPMRNLPGAVKLSIGGIDKTLGGIDAAITKAQSENTWDPKGEGARELLARKAQLEGRRNTLLKPYLGEGAGGGDYMGYGTPKAAPAGPAAPTTPAGKSVAAAPPGSVTLGPNGYAAGNVASTGLQQPAQAQQPAPASFPGENPQMTAAVQTELQRAAAERRPPNFPPELQAYAEQLMAAQSQGIQQSQAQAQAARQQELARQQAEQQAIRDSQRGR